MSADCHQLPTLPPPSLSTSDGGMRVNFGVMAAMAECEVFRRVETPEVNNNSS